MNKILILYFAFLYCLVLFSGSKIEAEPKIKSPNYRPVVEFQFTNSDHDLKTTRLRVFLNEKNEIPTESIIKLSIDEVRRRLIIKRKIMDLSHEFHDVHLKSVLVVVINDSEDETMRTGVFNCLLRNKQITPSLNESGMNVFIEELEFSVDRFEQLIF